MTGKQLFIEIEDDLENALSLIDMISAAAASDTTELNSASVERVAGMAIVYLKKAIEVCENETKE